MPSLKQLRYLAAIAETGHFSRAATQCHVTQPTLSAQLAALERRLGLVLVERGAHGAPLTPAGRRILERAHVALGCAEEILEIARAGKSGVVGTIRVGILPTLGPYMLPHLLPDIRRDYPELRLHVREESSDELLANLHRGRHDAIFTALPVRNVDLQVWPLFWEPVVMAVPSDHPLAGKTILEPDDLEGQTVLGLKGGNILLRQTHAVCERYGARLELDYESTSLDMLRIMVGLGLGIALLPALYVRSEITKVTNVSVARLPDPTLGRTIALITRSSAPRAGDYEALARCVKQYSRQKLHDVVQAAA